MENQRYCLLDLNTRKNLRRKYPGTCVLEYKSIVQIVINILTGWNDKTRYTLHSHISVWIENFNEVRNGLFHHKETVRSNTKK